MEATPKEFKFSGRTYHLKNKISSRTRFRNKGILLLICCFILLRSGLVSSCCLSVMELKLRVSLMKYHRLSFLSSWFCSKLWSICSFLGWTTVKKNTWINNGLKLKGTVKWYKQKRSALWSVISFSLIFMTLSGLTELSYGHQILALTSPLPSWNKI